MKKICTRKDIETEVGKILAKAVLSGVSIQRIAEGVTLAMLTTGERDATQSLELMQRVIAESSIATRALRDLVLEEGKRRRKGEIR